MIQVIKPGDENQKVEHSVTVFLAGSIEMGASSLWQNDVIKHLEQIKTDVTIFNPRRDDWNSSWEQKQSNPNFNEQVNWELDKLDESLIIFMYFDPNTKSPISLLELGKFIGCNMVVCCPEGFWRKGNIEILCTRQNTPLYTDFDSAIGALLTKISEGNRYGY